MKRFYVVLATCLLLIGGWRVSLGQQYTLSQALNIIIAAGKSLTVSNTMTLTATDGSSVAFGAGGTVLYNSGSVLAFGNSSATTTNTTQFFTPYGLITSVSVGTPLPIAATVKNMYVTTVNAPTGVQTDDLTVQKNGSDTTITCRITGAATTCNDTTHTASFVAGDTINIKAVPSATAAVTFYSVIVELVVASP